MLFAQSLQAVIKNLIPSQLTSMGVFPFILTESVPDQGQIQMKEGSLAIMFACHQVFYTAELF